MAGPSKSLRVLVTGSSGFTGAPLVEQLRVRGHQAFGLTRTPSAPGDIAADLLDEGSVIAAVGESQPDVVVHLAGISAPTHGSAAEIYSSNVVGSSVLLDALAKSRQPERLIVASSATVYAANGSSDGIDEEFSIDPRSDYANSKWCVETLCRLSAMGTRLQITRPFNYTGRGQAPNFFVAKVVEHFATRKPVLEVGNLDVVRDISSIDDVVECYVRLIESETGVGIVNLCSGSGIRLSDLVERASELSGHRLEVRRNPAFIRSGEPEVVIGSRARLNAAIGHWDRVGLDALLMSMLNAYSSRPGS